MHLKQLLNAHAEVGVGPAGFIQIGASLCVILSGKKSNALLRAFQRFVILRKCTDEMIKIFALQLIRITFKIWIKKRNI